MQAVAEAGAVANRLPPSPVELRAELAAQLAQRAPAVAAVRQVRTAEAPLAEPEALVLRVAQVAPVAVVLRVAQVAPVAVVQRVERSVAEVAQEPGSRREPVA